MGRYKALILDLDGTTVPKGYESVPSVKIIQAVKSARTKVPVCVATGRSVKDAKPVIDMLGGVDLCIFNGGAVLYDPKINQIIESQCLEMASLKQLMAICEPAKNRVIFSTLESEVWWGKESFKEEEVTGLFLIQLSPEEAEYYQNEFKKVPNIAFSLQTQTFDGQLVIILTHIKATKQRALEHVLAELQVHADEVVAVGDGENDLPMIIAAGMGVAMGNASDGLKSVADYIAPTVEQDGVAYVIEKFFS